MAGVGTIVQFVPFVSRLDAGFWHELSRRKLEKYHLNEDAQYISGYYANSKILETKYSLFQNYVLLPQIQCLVYLQIFYWNTVDLKSMTSSIILRMCGCC